jgi:hypothetical protein
VLRFLPAALISSSAPGARAGDVSLAPFVGINTGGPSLVRIGRASIGVGLSTAPPWTSR